MSFQRKYRLPVRTTSSPEPGSSPAEAPAIPRAFRVGSIVIALSLGLAVLPLPSRGETEAGTGSQLQVHAGALAEQAAAAYRRGDFEAAAILYDKAARAGFTDPIVFYNQGVAHYRAGELQAARAAFATAAAFDQLAPLACYNLGLIARKEGDYRDAHGWFRQAAVHPSTTARVKSLARSAIASLPEVKRRKPTLLAEEPIRLTDFVRFSFDTGYGTDSNVYRAPGSAYVDPTQAGAPLVVPEVQSGTFVPLDADLELRWSPYEQGYFAIRYEFDGRVYTKSELSNANAFRNRVSAGGRIYEEKPNGYRYFSSFFDITHYDENYYDRTDGGEVLIGTTDLTDRFQHTVFGPRIYYHRERGRLGYGIAARAFIAKYNSDFDDNLSYLDLTHEQYEAGAHVSWDLFRHTAVRVSYDRYRRDYTERLAKDATGVLRTSNGTLSYDYHLASLGVTQQLGRHFDLALSYQYTIRRDTFEGYDDYDRHSGTAALDFASRRLRANAGVIYRTYAFPNAFAFDLPGEPEKTLDTVYAFFEADYRIRQRYHIVLAGQFDIVDASDPRSAYDRNQLSVGLRWRL